MQGLLRFLAFADVLHNQDIVQLLVRGQVPHGDTQREGLPHPVVGVDLIGVRVLTRLSQDIQRHSGDRQQFIGR